MCTCKPCLPNVWDLAILLDCVRFQPFLVLVDLIKCEPINKRVRKLDLCLENCSALSCTTRPCPFSILIKLVRRVKCWNIYKHRSILFRAHLIETVLSRPLFVLRLIRIYINLFYTFCESLDLLFLWKLILVVALFKVNMLCESLYLLWHKGQPAMRVTNGCTSVLNPTSILSTPTRVDNKMTRAKEVY